jgi:hypothetical protein
MSRSSFVVAALGVALIISVTATAYTATHSRVTVTTPANVGITSASSIDASSFQAVFLQGGQVYYGHLTFQSSGDYKLTDVYYLQGSLTNLIKLGNETHKPQDAMFIPKTSVSFWENLQIANQFGGQLK